MINECKKNLPETMTRYADATELSPVIRTIDCGEKKLKEKSIDPLAGPLDTVQP